MLTMPTLGARADARAAKRRLLFASTVGCVGATLALTQAGPGDVWLALVAIVISNYCYCVGESVVAAFLPELARPAALGRVSGWGWSFGYCGGMLTLGLSLVVVTQAEARGMTAEHFVPWVIVVTCSVFALAALPSFSCCASARGQAQPPWICCGGWLCRRETGTHFPEFRRLLMCIACYQAGISVVITLSAVYASEVMGFTTPQIMLLVFTVNIGAAGAFSFGYVQDRIGHKRALAITLCGWILMVLVAYAAVTAPVFWIAATLAGLCMGTTQSAGRAMTGRWRRPPPGGILFAVDLRRAAGRRDRAADLRPVTWATHGNHRLAILVTGLFFVGWRCCRAWTWRAAGAGSRAPPPERRHRRHIGAPRLLSNCARRRRRAQLRISCRLSMPSVLFALPASRVRGHDGSGASSGPHFA